MKAKQLWTGIMIIGGIFFMNAQNVASTSTLTSGGNLAGTAGSNCTFYGVGAGKINSGASNSFFGSSAGIANTNGSSNIFNGYWAGNANTSGSENSYIGFYAGRVNTTGGFNVCLGSQTGANNNFGSSNVYVGAGAGLLGTNNNNNVCIGRFAGRSNANTSENVSIGNYAGANSQGSGNVFLGNYAGYSSTGGDKLFIDNSNTSTPLVWGDFALDQVKLNAKVGVGGVTAFPNTAGGVDLSTYKLFVKGGILAEEIRVTTTWADYVFEDNYTLPSLNEVECFIDENGHLPNVPSAKRVAQEGISVGEMAKIQQEKIEELTLYIIAQDKQLKEQQLKIERLEKQETEINDLKVLVQGLIDKK